MTRTRHTGEFKREAVKLALESDETYKVISDNPGINYKTLTYWIRASMASNTDKDKDIAYKSRYQQLMVSRIKFWILSFEAFNILNKD